MAQWEVFQEDVANFFRSKGAKASVEETVETVRGTHAIDVLIEFWYLGAKIQWAIECKKWSSRVPQEKVVALRTIVQDGGFDRGIIVSEIGFQSGAIQAAKNSNVYLLTFEELRKQGDILDSAMISAYTARLAIAAQRYWQHGKEIRQDYDLRPSIFTRAGEDYYSTNAAITNAFHVLKRAELREFPIHTGFNYISEEGRELLNSHQEVMGWLNKHIKELEDRLDAAEILMVQNGDYNPHPVPASNGSVWENYVENVSLSAE